MGQEWLVRVLGALVGASVVLPLAGLWLVWLFRRLARPPAGRHREP